MVKINKNFVLCFFVIVIFIVGCSPPTSSGEKGSEFRKGTDGLIVKFLSGAPPSKMYADEDTLKIIVSIEVWNKGAYPDPVEEGRMELWKTDKEDDVILISGFDPNIINKWEFESAEAGKINKYPYFLLEDKADILEGKNINNPGGGYDLLEFVGTADLKNMEADKYTPNFLVTACYDYKTKASPNVCVDPRPFSTVDERKVCEIKDISLSSQGAPVAITQVEVQALSNSLQFKIHFKNVGKGDVIATDVLKRCSGKDKKEDIAHGGVLKKSDIDLVKVVRVQMGDDVYRWDTGGSKLDCDAPVSVQGYGKEQKHRSYARLINDKGFIVCNLKDYKDDVSSAYSTPLYIELAYGYRDTISKSVEIVKVPKS